MGGCLGLPLGILQEKVLDLLPEEQKLEREKRISHTEQIIAGGKTQIKQLLPLGLQVQHFNVSENFC